MTDISHEARMARGYTADARMAPARYRGMMVGFVVGAHFDFS